MKNAYQNRCLVTIVLALVMPIIDMAQTNPDAEKLPIGQLESDPEMAGTRHFILGMSRLSGEGVLQNRQIAFDHFTKAAELGHPTGQEMMASCLDNGIGTAKNPQLAWKIYFKLANEDHKGAQLELAQKYTRMMSILSKEPSDEVYFIQAYKWASLAAKPPKVTPHLKIDQEYSKMAATVRNDLMIRASDLNISEAVIAIAQKQAEAFVPMAATPFSIGGTKSQMPSAPDPVSLAKTIEFQRRRAAEGSAQAQFDLGMRYLKGDGIAKDETQAKEWLEKSANGGNSLAKSALKKLSEK